MSPARILHNFISSNLKNKQLIWDLIKRDFKMRYLGSMMGSYWNLIHPIAMIAIYTLVFAKVMKIRLGGQTASPYEFTVYLCAGLLPWNAFQEVILRGSTQFHENANFIKKIAFPKEIIQSIATGSATIIFLFSMTLYFALILFSGHGFSSSILVLPILIFLQMILASGLGMILGVFNVFLRDVQQMLNIVFQLWFWLTPIVYSLKQMPAIYRNLFYLNPFYHFVRSYQLILVEKQYPELNSLIICGILALVFYTLGASILNHFQNQISDEI
ncbi:MAG: ABC transporter permease [Oligoflexales bacterium]